jgi:hypothetical protein
MESNSYVIRERTQCVPIKANLSTSMKEEEYSLKQNFFDPSKSSPPNEFMLKLHMRINLYNKTHNQGFVDIMDDSLDKE